MEKKTAVVTGSNSGIGLGIARALAAEGHNVVLNSFTDRDEDHKLAADIATEFGNATVYIKADLSKGDEARALVEKAAQKFGRVDILVNNAGIASRGRSVLDTEPEEIARLLTVHAMAPHWLSRRIIPNMRSRPRGDIIMISSVATLKMGANGAPYNMAKAAMEALAYTLAKEERGHGTHVNVVAPGLVETDMGTRLVKGAAGIDDIHALDKHMPYGRVCQPQDIANAVRFLVSPYAGYINGEKINVHGGGQTIPGVGG